LKRSSTLEQPKHDQLTRQEEKFINPLLPFWHLENIKWLMDGWMVVSSNADGIIEIVKI
jgi:hypothetical protein